MQPLSSIFELIWTFLSQLFHHAAASLESPSLTQGEGDFQGRVYKFFFKSSANASGLALTFAKPRLVVQTSYPCPTFLFYSAIF